MRNRPKTKMRQVVFEGYSGSGNRHIAAELAKIFKII